MRHWKDLHNTPMGNAIHELNQKMMEKDLPSIQLNAVGGFALMLHGERETTCLTDIDYIGDDLPEAIRQISAPIGLKYGLGKDWINNDVLLSGSNLRDMEFATGELHFLPGIALDKIQIDILCEEDLLKLKVIAIDTSLTALDLGGDFTRLKDFPDTIALMQTLHESVSTISEQYGNLIIHDQTIPILKAYMEHGETAVQNITQTIMQKHIQQTVLAAESPKQQRSPYMENLLNQLFGTTDYDVPNN